MKFKKLHKLARKAVEAAFNIEYSATYYFDIIQVLRHAIGRIKDIDALAGFEACPEFEKLSRKDRHEVITLLEEQIATILEDKGEHHPSAID